MEKRNISVDISEAYRYMGGIGAPDGSMRSELIGAAELIEKSALPRAVIKLCEIERDDFLSLKGTCLNLPGTSIEALLRDCPLCVIFCATVGNDIEALIRKWQIKDISFAAMLDSCASSAVEKLCDGIEAEVKGEYEAQGYCLTNRFSPGYGDLPICVQRDFCAALDTSRKIGVSVSDSGIMIPRKSVTAIIGLSKKPQKHFGTDCRDCELKGSCKFRENGVTCYGEII